MTTFAVDLDLLADLIERMGAFGRHLEAVQDEVDARMRRMHATWRGAAAAEHAAAHQRWLTGSAEMRHGLSVLDSIAATARSNYTSAVQANVSMWSS